MVMPGFRKLRTCFRTCLCASAACLKSFHISSLALSSTRFSSLVMRDTALRLGGETKTAAQHVQASNLDSVTVSKANKSIWRPHSSWICTCWNYLVECFCLYWKIQRVSPLLKTEMSNFSDHKIKKCFPERGNKDCDINTAQCGPQLAAGASHVKPLM